MEEAARSGGARFRADVVVETDVPARLDRLPWARFHWLVVIALGITWMLDGLEVTLAGSVAGVLQQTLHLSPGDVGLANSAYLGGAVCGALLFGWLTDRLGRKRLFSITLLVYLLATAATALSWNLASYAVLRCITGAGIGGEYSAINSAIQELIPARHRGWTDLGINGSFWLGAIIAAGQAIILLNPAWVAPELGWRIAFLGGAVIGLCILLLRRYVPESPRWLMIRGQADSAERTVATIEAAIARKGHVLEPVATRARIRGRAATPVRDVLQVLFGLYPRRALLGVSLMAAQAFFYNAIFFTYAMILTVFYRVPAGRVGWYVLPFAVGNVLGPLLLGRLFDTVGRKPMIVLTYALSAALLALTGLLFRDGVLTASTQTLCWSVTFFFASAAASSAYLVVGESFPLEVRALAIAIFYAVGTGLGGVVAPWLFGVLIESGSRGQVLLGYLLGAGLMGTAALMAAAFGVRSERLPLEAVARPLSWHDDTGHDDTGHDNAGG
jgi:MFS family permease